VPDRHGKTVADNLISVEVKDRSVIRPATDPYHAQGGLAVLFGNLAPEGCVVKQSAVVAQMMTHQGPARVFDSEEAATSAILEGKITAGDVV
jgi:dihydroxy-acid dehydratase